MTSDKAIVSRIRPVSWKVFVQGKPSAEYVRTFLNNKGVNCSEPVKEPELHDPAIYSIVATLKPETPLTAIELESLLAQDPGIELMFELREPTRQVDS